MNYLLSINYLCQNIMYIQFYLHKAVLVIFCRDLDRGGIAKSLPGFSKYLNLLLRNNIAKLSGTKLYSMVFHLYILFNSN